MTINEYLAPLKLANLAPVVITVGVNVLTVASFYIQAFVLTMDYSVALGGTPGTHFHAYALNLEAINTYQNMNDWFKMGRICGRRL